jgi:hypothetical protein
MRTAVDDLLTRLEACDPARGLTIDEKARGALWQQIASRGISPATAMQRDRLRTRLRARLRSLLIHLPILVVLAGGALGYQPALCSAASPCKRVAAVRRPASRSELDFGARSAGPASRNGSRQGTTHGVPDPGVSGEREPDLRRG